MTRKIFLLCAAAVLCGCAGLNLTGLFNSDTGQSPSPDSSQTSEENFWLTLPDAGKLTIIGIAGPQTKDELVISAAREHAARKASMFHNVHGSSVNIQSIGTGIFSYYADTATVVTYDENLQPYMDKLEYDEERDVLKVGNTTFIRFSYPASFPGNVSFNFEKDPDGRPLWTLQSIGEINGHLTGVGLARKQSRVSGTYAKSCESAVAAIVSQIHSRVSSEEISNSTSFQNTTTNYETNAGYLSNFLVLEVWMDPATEEVWTLAVAKK